MGKYVFEKGFEQSGFYDIIEKVGSMTILSDCLTLIQTHLNMYILDIYAI